MRKIERGDADHIFGTVPTVKRKDEATFDEYCPKRLILERYTAMVEAEWAGREHETAPDSPPVDPSLAQPESTRPVWAKPLTKTGDS